MKPRKTTEDYLKTIYILSLRNDVHACMIADQLGVSRPTVSVSLKRLEKEGLLKVGPGKVVSLTEPGMEIARPVFARYQVLQKFLISLGVSEHAAFHDACEMEHGLGEESYQALSRFTTRKKGPKQK